MQHNTIHSAIHIVHTTQYSVQHNTIHIVHTTQYSVQHNTIHSVQHKHIEKYLHSAYLHRRRKIFFSTGTKYNESKICVGGDVLFIS